ncbi:peptide chain release factor N(5)-glutamine methyltransferase [Bosea sp. TND4EK4]|uniref:peptide chain release factor N(5)-glutamine methyltransferase n=2 Tax=unclassified Bosea (in: a-proteobacteria) TaxID=2653178 RepID=UPI0009542CCF|nr:peptide chain release factor N(5)-glutamine methyltransferase [Bosea sp. TND4EK4]TAJ27778.1 MAG: peptide chain release factor N(5)-glutamine methyltransferase [Bosea sp. (in: a-proteobacteria)]SIQ10181.1 release factor glutamine methyltransferase [Bosea sp. TND4EK4]
MFESGAALTVRQARRLLVSAFAAAGLENAGLDARIMLETVLATRGLDPDARLAPEQGMLLSRYAQRRLAGEPTWRIIGEREFWGLTFQLSPATLEPRPDSETIVEAALRQIGARRSEALSILDLGTGTGCLLIALLSELPRARGLGIDVSDEACLTAAGNAARNGAADRARFQQGDWSKGLAGAFDVIVSNPPYIPSAEIDTLAPEVKNHDPRLALDGGEDGLAPYRHFARTLPALLKPEGFVVFEIGAGQKDDVVALMCAGGLEFKGSRNDLGGHERALIFAPA